MEYEWLPRIVIFIVMFGSGVALIWSARAAASGRLKRNGLAGIRTPNTLVSEDAWLAAHVRARRPTVYGGLAAIMSAVFALLPGSAAMFTAGVLIGAAIMLGLVIYAAWASGKAAIAVSGQRL